MPMPNPMSGMTTQGNSTKKIVVAVVVIAVVVVVGYLLSRGGQDQPGGAANQPGGQATNAGGNGGTNLPPGMPPAPAEVFSYVGVVQSVGNGQLSLLARPVINYLDKETILNVKVDSSTQIIRRIIPKVLPKEGGINPFKQETITLSDIKKGDQATVVSATNIKNKTDFTASRIELLVVK